MRVRAALLRAENGILTPDDNECVRTLRGAAQRDHSLVIHEFTAPRILELLNGAAE